MIWRRIKKKNVCIGGVQDNLKVSSLEDNIVTLSTFWVFMIASSDAICHVLLTLLFPIHCQFNMEA